MVMWSSSTVIVIFIVLILLSFLGMLVDHEAHNPQPVKFELVSEAQCLHLANWTEVPSRRWDTTIDSFVHILLRAMDRPLETYLRLLRNSVSIVEVPCMYTPTVDRANQECSDHKKAIYMDHQHSLEVRFPRTLKQMQAAGQRYNHPELQFLWQNGSSNFDEPLFYYLQSYQYYVTFCSFNQQGQESWEKGVQYIHEISSYVLKHSEDFQRNKGLDFLVAASHPINGNGPWGTNSAYQRQTFLRTDFDYTGSRPKDIVVPYYTPWRPHNKTHTNSGDSRAAPHLRVTSALPREANGMDSTTGNATGTPRNSVPKLLLYFSGGKNPPGGLREELESAMARLQREDSRAATDVLFTTDRSPFSTYEVGLEQSVFCAHVRGDTASSSRLFQIIEAGCIPVVISDWLKLPYERIIDYSKFTLRFPESVVHDVGRMIAYLRRIPPQRVQAMQEAVSVAKGLLLFPPSSHGGHPPPVDAEFRILNPVTLALVEMVMRRKEYCDALSTSPVHAQQEAPADPAQPLRAEHAQGSRDKGDMCAKLYARLRLVEGAY